MIRNEPGIRIVPHIIVRASMQIACCSLSRRREKLSTNTNTNTDTKTLPELCKLPAEAYQGGGKSWVQSLHSCWVVKKILLATSVINTKHADDFDYNCVVFLLWRWMCWWFLQNVFVAIAHLNFVTFAQLLRVKLFKVPPSSNYFPAVSKNTRFLFVNHQHWSLMTNDGCIVLAFTTTGV